MFLILKSYSLNIIYPSTDFIIKIKKENEIIILERNNIMFLNNLSFWDFTKWIQYRLKYDWKYIDNSDIYCFSFILNDKLIKEEDINYLKPIYPWNEKILNELGGNELNEIFLRDEINKNKKIISMLKHKIKKLEKKYYK